MAFGISAFGMASYGYDSLDVCFLSLSFSSHVFANWCRFDEVVWSTAVWEQSVSLFFVLKSDILNNGQLGMWGPHIVSPLLTYLSA